jgi:hypothetical protein
MTEIRGRADRATEEAAQRRRRDDTTLDGAQRLKLAVPEDVAKRLQAEGREPRWVNDEGNRMHQLTKLDDYDRVDGVPARVVGTTKEGKPIKAYLCSKPKEFIEQDRRKADAPRVEFEKALERGKNPDDPIAGDDSFYADPANKISRGGSRSP